MKKAGKKQKLLLLFSLIAFSILLVDQFLKILVSKILSLKMSIPLIKGFIDLTYSKNFGAGFSILEGFNWFFILVALLFIFIVIFYYKKVPQVTYLQVGLGLFLGGTISNLIDRVFLGYVIDYIDFKIFYFSNNLADIGITVGAAIIIFYYIFMEDKKVNKKKVKKSKKK